MQNMIRTQSVVLSCSQLIGRETHKQLVSVQGDKHCYKEVKHVVNAELIGVVMWSRHGMLPLEGKAWL